jgi:hypothetical protein
MEVYIRERCDNQECRNGRVLTGNAKLPWEHCGNCSGTGYVKTWADLEVLIEDVLIRERGK